MVSVWGDLETMASLDEDETMVPAMMEVARTNRFSGDNRSVPGRPLNISYKMCSV